MTRKSVPADSYGGRLALAMREAGLTNAALAELLGVDPATVSQWRTNVFQPDEKRNEIVAAAVNRAPAWLRYGVAAEPTASRAPEAISGGTVRYPRHLEGMVKRWEADLEEAPISDALRASLQGVLRAPEEVARYWTRFDEGTDTAEAQVARLAPHVALLRALLTGLIADALGVDARVYPVAEDGDAVRYASDVARRAGTSA